MLDLKGFTKRHRGALSGIGMILAVVLIFWTVNNSALVGASASSRQLPVYSVQRDEKVVAISFDAAWADAKLPVPNLDNPSASLEMCRPSFVAKIKRSHLFYKL